MGLGRLELPTSRLSGVRSNHLSYKPALAIAKGYVDSTELPLLFSLKGGDPAAGSPTATLLRLRPSRLPYRGRQAPDKSGYLNAVRQNKLPWRDGRCVQDPGTYSPRHADPRLLAIPTSCSRVAENNPN